MSRRTPKPPLPIPQGYRLLTRVGIKCLPGDIRQSLAYKPRYYHWQRAYAVQDGGRYCSIVWDHSVHARPIDRKVQRRPAGCCQCGVPYPLKEVTPGRLVCNRCVGRAKATVTRHFNIVRRLGGIPTYEGAYVDSTEAARRHVQRTLCE